MAKWIDKRAPGRRVVKRLSLNTKYWLLGGLSAVLVGTGLSILSEAGYLKHSGVALAQWFVMGVYGFVLTIGGLGLMQISTRFRVMMDVRQALRKERKKARKARQRIEAMRRRENLQKQNPVGRSERGSG